MKKSLREELVHRCHIKLERKGPWNEQFFTGNAEKEIYFELNS